MALKSYSERSHSREVVEVDGRNYVVDICPSRRCKPCVFGEVSSTGSFTSELDNVNDKKIESRVRYNPIDDEIARQVSRKISDRLKQVSRELNI